MGTHLTALLLPSLSGNGAHLAAKMLDGMRFDGRSSAPNGHTLHRKKLTAPPLPLLPDAADAAAAAAAAAATARVPLITVVHSADASAAAVAGELLALLSGALAPGSWLSAEYALDASATAEACKATLEKLSARSTLVLTIASQAAGRGEGSGAGGGGGADDGHISESLQEMSAALIYISSSIAWWFSARGQAG